MARVEDSPWAIPVAQIASRAGQSKPIDADFPAPSGIGDSIVGIKEGEPVHVSGQFDSMWTADLHRPPGRAIRQRVHALPEAD